MAWVKVDDRLPEPGIPVIVYVPLLPYGDMPRCGLRLRAQYSDGHSMESDGEEDAEYDEVADIYYCPKGWYETNEFEETHWRISGEVTHWMPLPDPPAVVPILA